MWWLIGVILAAALLLIWGWVQTGLFKRTDYVYTDTAVPPTFSGFRIAQVSDYHNSPFPRHGKPLLDAVRASEPDLIVLTGDLFNRKRPDGCEQAFAFVEAVRNIAPVFFVEGNHEMRLERYPRWRRQLIELGVIVLEDAAVTLYRGGSALGIVGMRQMFDTDTLLSLCGGPSFHLVLSHRCERMEQYAAAGRSLVLTGHAHGGQVRVLGLSAFAPEQGVCPRYVSGPYRSGAATVYVSRGIGNTIRFPRVFNLPEWNLITLSDGSDIRR